MTSCLCFLVTLEMLALEPYQLLLLYRTDVIMRLISMTDLIFLTVALLFIISWTDRQTIESDFMS